MRGTIISHTTKSGKKSWGYSYFAGRDETGRRIQKLRRGFARKGDAEAALRKAIEDHQKTPDGRGVSQVTARNRSRLMDSALQGGRSGASSGVG
jgi:hypothetical protein